MAACFSFFSEVVGSITLERFNELCSAAWKEESGKALALFVWLGTRPQGDVREEMSADVRADKKNFYRAMIWLHSHSPSTLLVNLEQIALLTSVESLLDILTFVKIGDGPSSLETSLAPSGDEDWRQTATPDKLQTEYDCFVGLDTFSHLQVEAQSDPFVGDEPENVLFDAVVEIVVKGLQGEMERVRSDRWDWKAYSFAMAAPTRGSMHDQLTNIVDAIVARFCGGGGAGDPALKAKYEDAVLELRKAEEARRKKLRSVALSVLPAPPSTIYQNQKIEKQFKRELFRVMGAPVKDHREAMRQFLIIKSGIEQANRHLKLQNADSTPSHLVRCEFSPKASVTIGNRKVSGWKASSISVDPDMVEEWEDKLQGPAGKRGARKGGAKKNSAELRVILGKARKGVAKDRPDSEIEEAAKAQPTLDSSPGTVPDGGMAGAKKAGKGTKVQAWMSAVSAECARIAGDEEALRIIEEVQRAEWQRRVDEEVAREEAAREGDEALKAGWVREVERQYAEVEAEAEEFLSQVEEQGRVLAGVDAEVQEEWIQQVQRQYSKLQLEEMRDNDEDEEDEDEETPAGLAVEREFSASHLTAVPDERAQASVQDVFRRMAKQLVKETSNFLADEGQGLGASSSEEEGQVRHKMWIELPLEVVMAQMGIEVDSEVAELLAGQDLGEEDAAAMAELDAALEEEWVHRVATEADEVQDAGEAFVNDAVAA